MPGDNPSVQERYAPKSACFGCGPANPRGLRIRSFPVAGRDDALSAQWQPANEHEAFAGALSGGIISALLDCHANWTAAYHLMKKRGAKTPPCTVTSDLAVEYKRPTPTAGPVQLDAAVIESSDERAVVEARISAGGKTTAICRATFVAVRPEHPAYHRW